jgi:hypothetical protein
MESREKGLWAFVSLHAAGREGEDVVTGEKSREAQAKGYLGTVFSMILDLGSPKVYCKSPGDRSLSAIYSFAVILLNDYFPRRFEFVQPP